MEWLKSLFNINKPISRLNFLCGFIVLYIIACLIGFVFGLLSAISDKVLAYAYACPVCFIIIRKRFLDITNDSLLSYICTIVSLVGTFIPYHIGFFINVISILILLFAPTHEENR